MERFPAESIVITGGVAQNQALVKFIESGMDLDKVTVPENHQLNGAIGCCFYSSLKEQAKGDK